MILNNADNIMVGSRQVSSVYAGSQLVWNKGGLPSGYTKVLYLRSTGTQAIDTGYTPNNSSGFELKLRKYDTADTIQLGCCTGTDGRWASNFAGNQPNIAWNSITYVGSVYTIDTPYIARLNYRNNSMSQVFNADGSLFGEVDISSKGTLATQSYTALMFAGHWRSSSISLASNCAIYYAQITEGTNIVRNFIPCLDPNNTPCMYDTVTAQAYYNIGTGDFSYASF